MQQNELFDAVILGASIEGIALAEYIKAKDPKFKLAIVSRHFNFVKQINKLADTALIIGESVFSSFNHGLIMLTLRDKRVVVCKNLVMATGGMPIKSTSDKFKGNKNICYSPKEVTVNPKNKPAVVYGNGQDAVSYTLALAKRFKYVYLCSSVFELSCDEKSAKKLEETPNVVHLPNCTILTSKNNKEGKLSEITLSTYDAITCSALVLALGRVPDSGGVDPKMLELDDGKYIKTNARHQSVTASNIYAIGECARHNTKRSLAVVGNCLMSGGDQQC